jgi:hypothetical protein
MSTKDNPAERRKFPRYTYNLPVSYQALASETVVHCPHCGGSLVVSGRDLDQLLTYGTARTQTLSLGGMAIEVERSFAPGRQLLLQFPIRNELICVRGTVVLGQRAPNGLYRIGLEFLDLSEYHREVLVDYFADSLLREARDRTLQKDEDLEEQDEDTGVHSGGPV